MFETSNKLKEKFDRFPIEAQRALEKSINQNVIPLKESIINQNEALQNEILALKDQLIQANEFRLHSATQINDLNSKIRQHRMFEDVKRKELELMMYEKKNKYNGGAKNRTEIPDLPLQPFEFPRMPRNFEQRIKNKMANRVYVEPQQLYTQMGRMRVPQGAVSPNDQFDDFTVAARLMDRDRAKHPEFYEVERLAVKLPERFYSIGEDYTNKQNIVMPRFGNDRMDEDRNLIDIFNNNEDRLKALDGGARDRGGMVRRQEKVDFDRVDRIIDALDSFKDKYFDDRQQERIHQKIDLSVDPRECVV